VSLLDPDEFYDPPRCVECGAEESHKLTCFYADERPADPGDEEGDDEDDEHRMPWSDDDIPDGGGP